MQTTLFAYTPPEASYPPYINISLVDGKYRITVRSPSVTVNDKHIVGDTAFIDIEAHIFEQLHAATANIMQRPMSPTSTKIYFD